MVQNCPKCGHEMTAESIGWMCRGCRGFVDMQGNFHEHKENPFMPPITNADRIREMSDEDLADMRIFYDPEIDMYTTDTGKTYYDYVSAMEDELEWLKQPADMRGEEE